MKSCILRWVLPWKPLAASCCIASETAARSTGSWGCRSGPAPLRGPPGRPPRSCCPVLTWAAPWWPWPRCCLQSCCRGRTLRAVWTVWLWAALREYASQQLGSVPPDWVVESRTLSEEKQFFGGVSFSPPDAAGVSCPPRERRGWRRRVEEEKKSHCFNRNDELQRRETRAWRARLNYLCLYKPKTRLQNLTYPV